MRWGGVVALVCIAGCGGSDASGSCSDFAACGGDVVGTWSVQSLCGKEQIRVPGCSAVIDIDLDGLTPSGMQTYQADGTSVVDMTFAGTFTAHWPAVCLTAGGGSLSCADLDMAFMASVGMDDTVESVTCGNEGRGCACKFTAKPQVMRGSGHYMVDGHTLVEDGERNDYCVTGSTLRLKPSAPLMPQAMVTASVNATLIRQ